jgi:hypothetical protein
MKHPKVEFFDTNQTDVAPAWFKTHLSVADFNYALSKIKDHMNRYPEILVTLKGYKAVDEKTGAVDIFQCPVEIIYQLAYSILRKDHEEILKKYIVLFVIMKLN